MTDTSLSRLKPLPVNLARALQSIEVTPSAFVLTVNTILGQASRQLKVTGHLIDGKTTLDQQFPVKSLRQICWANGTLE